MMRKEIKGMRKNFAKIQWKKCQKGTTQNARNMETKSIMTKKSNAKEH